MKNKIKYLKQQKNWTCGPACMRIVLSAFNINKSEKFLSQIMKTNKKTGTSFKQFKKTAKKFNLKYIEKDNADIKQLKILIKNNFVVIVGYFLKDEKEEHYAVVKKISEDKIYLLDTEKGKNHSLIIEYFNKVWRANPKIKRWFIAIKDKPH